MFYEKKLVAEHALLIIDHYVVATLCIQLLNTLVNSVYYTKKIHSCLLKCLKRQQAQYKLYAEKKKSTRLAVAEIFSIFFKY